MYKNIVFIDTETDGKWIFLPLQIVFLSSQDLTSLTTISLLWL